MNNYFTLSDIHPFKKTIAFVDANEGYAFRVFANHGIRTFKILGIFGKPEDPYEIVMCQINKTDLCKLHAAAAALAETIEDHGHDDYAKYCAWLIEQLELEESDA